MTQKPWIPQISGEILAFTWTMRQVKGGEGAKISEQGISTASNIVSILASRFKGSDLIWALVSNFWDLLKEDGIPVESILKLDFKKHPHLYDTFLDVLFQTVIQKFFTQDGIKVISFDTRKNEIIAEGKNGIIFTTRIQLHTFWVSAWNTLQLLTEIDVFWDKSWVKVPIWYISKGQVYKAYK